MDDDVAAWAGSGVMALTGRAHAAPLGPPRYLVRRLTSVATTIARASAGFGRPVELDALALLGERAALAGLRRCGMVSCGGHTRLLPTADGQLAVTMARRDDDALVWAWLQRPGEWERRWDIVAAEVATRNTEALVARGRLLGLPVSGLPPRLPRPKHPALPVVVTRHGDGMPVPASLDQLTVVDLSALWAGPLCTNILQLAGAAVIRIESTHRPDPMRWSQPSFFDRLNAGKRSVALDIRSAEGLAALRLLLSKADIVVEASRPRALEQLGIRAEAFLDTGRPRVWVSITGYGRRAPGRDWVAFGDDAAVAGGLVARDAAGPVFCGDAIADPCTGLVAAAACLQVLAAGGKALVDVSMSGVAAWLAGPTVPVPAGVIAAPPRARPVGSSARPLGADTDAVLAEAATR